MSLLNIMESVAGMYRPQAMKIQTGQALVATPIILATQEAEIRRILVQTQPGGSRYPILRKPITKRAGGVAQEVCPEFKPQY
jgi:hypothetical protein